MGSRLFVIVLGLGWLSCIAESGRAIDRTWIGGSDFWNIDSNWSPTGQPQPADKAIVDGSPEVTDVEIFDELDNSGDIRITTGTLQSVGNTMNTGTINVGDGSAMLSSFNPGNSTTLAGSGQVILQNSDNLPGSNATIVGGTNIAGAVTNAAGHTIRGEGSITLNWINEGTIIAEETTGDSSAVLRLNNITSFVNNGELRSSPGATINLNFVTYSQGAGGQLIADSDSITLTGLTSVSGGSLETVGGGVFDSNGLVTLSGVTVNSPIDNSNTSGPINDARLFVSGGGITNNSTITLEGVSGRNSQFGFTSSGTLNGTGEILLVGGNSQTFVGVFPGVAAEFTHGANHTIRGAGAIGSPIINNGTVRAEVQHSNLLTINSPQTNHGLLEAASGAILRFVANVSDTTQSSTGVISAANGGRVELQAQVITGGTLQSTGTGEIVVDSTAPTLSDLTIAAGSNVNVFGNRTLRIAGNNIINNGTITLNSNAVVSTATLQANSNISLSGTGEVFLNEQDTNFPAVIRPNGNTITQATGHTVRGAGQLIGAGKFVNDGRIEGTSTASPIRIRTRLEGEGVFENLNVDRGTFDIGIFAPGNGIGTATLEGSFVMGHPQARMEIQIGGLVAGTEHDHLSSTGTVALAGVLDVLAIDLSGYTPTAGDRFEIINSTSPITGTFNTVHLPAVGFGRTLTWLPVDYTTDPHKVFLEIATVNFLDADFDTDGDVDGADLTFWQTGYGIGNAAAKIDGDADDDGDVDGRDFLIWQRQFTGSLSIVASTTVPEPSAYFLLILPAILGICLRSYCIRA
jgi:hypothetical protein